MDMIHYMRVKWHPNGHATYTLPDDDDISFLNKNDPVYLAGGFVHRILVTVSDTEPTETRDLQLCDMDICPSCSGPNVPPPHLHTGVLANEAIRPFVHSQDIKKDGVKWVFEPVKGRSYQATLPPKTFIRRVKFVDGVEREVQVCDVKECEVCGAARPE